MILTGGTHCQADVANVNGQRFTAVRCHFFFLSFFFLFLYFLFFSPKLAGQIWLGALRPGVSSGSSRPPCRGPAPTQRTGGVRMHGRGQLPGVCLLEQREACSSGPRLKLLGVMGELQEPNRKAGSTSLRRLTRRRPERELGKTRRAPAANELMARFLRWGKSNQQGEA